MALEERIGTRWFSRIGIVSIFVATLFLIKYAIDINLLGPAARVGLGVASGAAMLGAGEYLALRRHEGRYGYLSMALMGGSFALLYLSVYSAHGFYALLSLESDLAALVAIVALGILYSLRHDSRLIASEAFILGYISPLISTINDYSLIYIAVLTAGLILIAVRKKWSFLGYGGMAAVYMLSALRLVQSGSPGHLPTNVSFLTLCFAMLTSLLFGIQRRGERGERDSGPLSSIDLETAGAAEAVLGASANSVIFYLLLAAALAPHDFSRIGPATAALAAAQFLLAALAHNLRLGALRDAHIVFGLSFLTLAVPLWSPFWAIAPLWAIEGLSLVLLTLLRERKLEPFTHVVCALAAGKSLLLDLWVLGQPGMLGDDVLLRAAALSIPPAALLAASVAMGRRRTLGGMSASWEYYLATGELIVALALIVELPGAWATVAWGLQGLALSALSIGWSERITNHASVMALAVVLKAVAVDSWALAGVTSDAPLAGSLPLAFIAPAASLAAGAVALREFARPDTMPEKFWPHHLAGAVVLVAALAALELRGALVTVAWSILALALLALGFFWSERLRLQANAVLGAAVLKALLVDSWMLKGLAEASSLPESRLLAFSATGALAGVAAAVYYVKRRETVYEDRLWEHYMLGFDHLYSPRQGGAGGDSGVWKAHFSLLTLALAVLLALELKDAAISAGWALEALAVSALGFGARLSFVRKAGIALFLVTTIKVFIIDLAGLETLLRIVSFMLLGLILLGVSYLYHRYRERL